MPQKRPPDRDEDNSNGPPPKNPTITRPASDPDQLMKDLSALSGKSSQSNNILLQSIINMMSMFIETIKDLRQEIRELKEIRPPSQNSNPPIPNRPTPIKPHAWVNPYPKQSPANIPKPPPKNADINRFKAATLIIHKTPGLEPFKGLKNTEIVQ